MAGSNGTRLALGILLCCALAYTVIITRPCTYILSRTILAATGLNPLLIYCAKDGSEARLPKATTPTSPAVAAGP